MRGTPSAATHAERSEYLIEVPHSPEECSAAQLTVSELEEESCRTYCGCGDGTHTTWIIAELASENEAWSLVPRILRDTARVTRIERCTSDDSLDKAKGGSL
jgi:hypothetical protein